MTTLTFPIPKRPPAEQLDALDIPLWDRFPLHPELGLTPGRVLSFYRMAEQGYPQQQCDLFDGVVERDGHLRSQIEMRIDAVAGKEWILQPGGDDPQSLRAAAELDEALRQCPTWDEAIEHHLEANLDGYAASTIRWERVTLSTGATVWAPSSFGNVPPRRFRFDVDEVPWLLTRDKPGIGIPLTPGGWWLTYRRGRLAASAGLLRTATWWALFKSMAVRDWILFCNRFGLPWVTGLYDTETNEQEKKALRTAVTSLGTDRYGIMHRSTEMKIEWPQHGGKTDDCQGALAARCDAENSKLITGGTLTSGEGTSTGSYALGRVHEARMFELGVADVKRIRRSFAEHVAAPFLWFNGYTDAKIPIYKVHLVQNMDPAVRIAVMSRFANELGGTLDEDQVRQEFQFKPPTGKSLAGTIPGKVDSGPGGGGGGA